MRYCVLGVGYSSKEQKAEKEKWTKHEINFEFVDTWIQAINQLHSSKYNCVVICADYIKNSDLHALKNIQTVPIVIMPSGYSIQQRQEYAVFSVLQYINVAGLSRGNHLDKSVIQECFELKTPVPRPLTIVTAKALSICLESRSVEVCGQTVNLTSKEFDILALLLCNQCQVFTHEMIINRVWNEEASFYSKKIVTTHISNIRRKIKAVSDSANYIQSIYGVGYKFKIDG